MSANWYEVTIAVTTEVKELITNHLFEVGAGGVNENVANPNLLQAYFPEEQKDQAIKDIHSYWMTLQENFTSLPSIQITLIQVAEENWAETYKQYYLAQKLTDLFFLRPKWDTTTPIPLGMIPIFMEPGQAFGTGLHPSTKLCLKALQSEILHSTRKDKLRCLDVGTGTGILALAAYHLGVKQIIGIDNDSVAVEVAKENMELNKASEIEMSEMDIRTLKPSFDFVISNILLETLRELATEYARLIPLGGSLLLSGLLGYQKRELCEFINPTGFVLLESRNFQEWASFLFLRRDR